MNKCATIKSSVTLLLHFQVLIIMKLYDLGYMVTVVVTVKNVVSCLILITTDLLLLCNQKMLFLYRYFRKIGRREKSIHRTFICFDTNFGYKVTANSDMLENKRDREQNGCNHYCNRVTDGGYSYLIAIG